MLSSSTLLFSTYRAACRLIHGMVKPVSLFAYHSPRSKEQSPANRSCVGDHFPRYAPAVVPQESDTDMLIRVRLGKLLDFCQSQLGTCDSVGLSSALEKTRIPQIG
jgi:hypothetical protein